MTLEVKMSRSDVLIDLNAQCRKWGNQTKLARAAGVSVSLVNKMKAGERDITAAVARALGYRVVTTYEKIPQI